MEPKHRPEIDRPDCTANGVFKYDHPFNTVPLNNWVHIVYGLKVPKPGTFGYDNICMAVGRLFQNLTFDVEVGSDIVHEACKENYNYWIINKPWNRGYKKSRTLRDERLKKYSVTNYFNLSEDEKDKDRVIARCIIKNHIDYQLFVRSFTPRQLEELENKTFTFPSSPDPMTIKPTIIVNDTTNNIIRKTIDYYKNATYHNHIYDFSNDRKIYLGPTSQVALTSKFRGKLVGSRGVVVSVDDVDGEELPLVRFLDGDEVHVNYINGEIPLMMANYVALESDIKFELEMCIIDGEIIDIDHMSRALEKARTFDCVEVRNIPSWTPDTVLDLITDPQWKQILGEAFSKDQRDEFLQLFSSWVWSQYDNTIVFPPKHEIFEALNASPFDEMKVVIIGQDPYHTPNKAHGLSFSVRNGIQPSLRNIYTELKRTGFTTPNKSGNLMKWAKQGVLLLNTVLTVCSGKANSHIGKGWERITDEIIQQINMRKDNIVFMLWGAAAQKKITFIDINRHCVLKAVHPSPMATGYVGCNCFSDANEYLNKKGIREIDWNLSD
jgi:uracil-DNA glycosylase